MRTYNIRPGEKPRSGGDPFRPRIAPRLRQTHGFVNSAPDLPSTSRASNQTAASDLHGRALPAERCRHGRTSGRHPTSPCPFDPRSPV